MQFSRLPLVGNTQLCAILIKHFHVRTILLYLPSKKWLNLREVLNWNNQQFPQPTCTSSARLFTAGNERRRLFQLRSENFSISLRVHLSNLIYKHTNKDPLREFHTRNDNRETAKPTYKLHRPYLVQTDGQTNRLSGFVQWRPFVGTNMSRLRWVTDMFGRKITFRLLSILIRRDTVNLYNTISDNKNDGSMQ